MKSSVTILLVVALTLGGCGRLRESRLNPFNWFGRSTEQTATQTVAPAVPDDGRILVAQVTDMEVARQPGGAIIRATGLPPTQGFWDAALVAENSGFPVDGVMTYRFVVAEPIPPARVSTPQSREVSAAAYISNIKLEGVRQIVVLGSQNSRSSRR
ncbi:hypothetical protein DEA8626_01645 [Defluviimonas aquaemixtae]|uniref:Lipoprotein n=1 Tax=Albidovulum aquaemixtae TaxID=1542388 RepID=A0A2R8B665_9RHOB|nr:hypothetical protein [Defluviimonas aquaemixtae]SPH18115.1 hypothetical protein DEA8626_01645 [Defluviimonas aquaemixtae]